MFANGLTSQFFVYWKSRHNISKDKINLGYQLSNDNDKDLIGFRVTAARSQNYQEDESRSTVNIVCFALWFLYMK